MEIWGFSKNLNSLIKNLTDLIFGVKVCIMQIYHSTKFGMNWSISDKNIQSKHQKLAKNVNFEIFKKSPKIETRGPGAQCHLDRGLHLTTFLLKFNNLQQPHVHELQVMFRICTFILSYLWWILIKQCLHAASQWHSRQSHILCPNMCQSMAKFQLS